MGFKQFFRKIERGSKDFFKKGGIAETALRKTGNTLSQAAPIVEKIGGIAKSIAPELSLIPVVGGALSQGATAFGNSSPQISQALTKLGSNAKHLSKGIQAPKPEQEQLNIPFA